jgi:hypothetical protein
MNGPDLMSEKQAGLLRAAVEAVQLQWGRYVEREEIELPTVPYLRRFLRFQYDIQWNDDLSARFAGVSDPHGVVDMETVIPRIADMLLDSRLGPVTKP